MQGMILLSELSRRRIRSIHKLLRVGRKEIVMVIRCDKGQSMLAMKSMLALGLHACFTFGWLLQVVSICPSAA